MAASAPAIESLLPRRLIDFFIKYPPERFGVYYTGQKIETLQEKIALYGNKKSGKLGTKGQETTTIVSAIAPTRTVPISEVKSRTSSSTASSSSITASTPLQSVAEVGTATATSTTTTTTTTTDAAVPAAKKFPPNPFQPIRNRNTGHWRGPEISLRAQAELCKLARAYGVEPLLPPSIKGSAYKEQKLLERGLAVKGTGVEQTVKGHKWERKMAPTIQKRIEAMEKMPEMIKEWKRRGHGRGWKKFPR